MTIYLFTEDGPSGEAIEILARKLLQINDKNFKIKRRRVKQGDIFKNHKKLKRVIELGKANEKRMKAIVCVDSECTDTKDIEANLQSSRKALKGLAHFLIIVHALETWLAADEEALRTVLSSSGQLSIPSNLEGECRPANILKEVFKRHGKDFIKSRDDLKIAEHADPSCIAKRCTSFRNFQQLLLKK